MQRRPGLLFALLCASFFLLIAPASAAQTHSLLDNRLRPNGPATVILVARDGKIVFSKGFGLADRENGISATPGTPFCIGSITKQFTAAAILTLQEDGKLTVDDPLSKFFPHYPNGEKITLRQLLTHTSGLHDYTLDADFFSKVTRPISPAALIASFENDPPDFPPGDQFCYSNTGYYLLGQIVAQVSGKPLEQYLRERFFVPLGMHDTGLWESSSPPQHAARGYSLVKGRLAPALRWNMSWIGGAGELYSTTNDLWRWTEALHHGRVLSDASLKLMLQEPIVRNKGSLRARYGMGLFTSEIEWLPAIGHDGGLQGFLSSVRWFPDSKVTIVILSNAMPGAAKTTPGVLLPLVVRTFLASEIAARTPKPDQTINPKGYLDYVGRYDYHENGVQQITEQAGHLYAQLTGQKKLELVPSGPDAFFFKTATARILFNRNPSGQVESLMHIQGESTFLAPKLAGVSAPILSAKELDAFIGRYRFDQANLLTVTRRGTQLYASFPGQPKSPIFPKSDDEFYWEDCAASVDFVRDAQGDITGAIQHQSGLVFNAAKLRSN